MNGIKENTEGTCNILICSDVRISLERSHDKENRRMRIEIKIPDTINIHTIQVGNMSYSFNKNISEYEINVYSTARNNLLCIEDFDNSIIYKLSTSRAVYHLVIDESTETLKITRTYKNIITDI